MHIMKATAWLAAGLLLLAACAPKKAPVLVPAENFNGSVDQHPVALYTLKNGDITLQVTNYGARVVSLFTPDKHGDYEDIVVGRNSLEEYVHPSGERFLGACVGPVANRIGGASFDVYGETFHTPCNDNGVNTLHGGFRGVDHVVWDVVQSGPSSITFRYVHPDGQEGFPGNLDILMSYTLTEQNEFIVMYKATTDKATPVNLSHHSFFNLRGEGNGTVEDYLMKINADRFIPIDSLSIPTGEIRDVEGTPFDFRKEHRIGDRIGETSDTQIRFARGYDHNWCLNADPDGKVVSACTVWDPETGRQLEVLTDQPGLQFYSGNFFDGSDKGKNGKPLGFRSSLALETQKWPDSPNHDNFTDVLVLPAIVYKHTCVYRFTVRR